MGINYKGLYGGHLGVREGIHGEKRPLYFFLM